jgi:hypothetical protein
VKAERFEHGETFEHAGDPRREKSEQRREEPPVADYEGYCVKCRETRTFEGNEVQLANGRRAAQGSCPVCGTKMNRILGKTAI